MLQEMRMKVFVLEMQLAETTVTKAVVLANGLVEASLILKRSVPALAGIHPVKIAKHVTPYSLDWNEAQLVLLTHEQITHEEVTKTNHNSLEA